MHLHFRHRLSSAERLFWLMLALLLGLAISGHAQSSHRPTVVDYGSSEEFVRNHGTGVRFGTELAAARNGGLMTNIEAGLYHQHRLGGVGSVQVEALYFCLSAPATATAQATAASGLRLPVMLVLNPLDNISLHFGPQLRWQSVAPRATEAGLQKAPSLMAELVMGAEARLGRGRVGVRYAMPATLLADLPATGDRIGAAWKTGRLQVYAGIDVFKN